MPAAPLLTAERIREVEAAHLARLPTGSLMQRAARAVVDEARILLRGLPRGSPVDLLVGPGNNGGDALLAGLGLLDLGFPVRAWAWRAQGPSAPDAARVHRQWRERGLRLQSLSEFLGLLDAPAAGRSAGLVIDGLFGIGLRRPLPAECLALAVRLEACRAMVLAIDLPSGLDADSGMPTSAAPGGALAATRTVTMIADKPGLRTGLGPAVAGEVVVAPLGLDVGSDPRDGLLLDEGGAGHLLQPRSRVAHKGSFGAVLVLGGGPGLRGAAVMAASAAQASGAGKVWLACPNPDEGWVPPAQLMSRRFEASSEGADAVVIGCGLGREAQGARRLAEVLAEPKPCVIDADALNLVAGDAGLRDALAARTQPALLTPHPLEAARLLGCPTEQIQADRVGSARRLAAACRAVVVLKGAGSVIADPGGRWAINRSGSVALAVGGTGDVLAGLLGGLLAQGYGVWEAACLGVWMHGHAGERWQRAHPQGAGLNPGELSRLLPDAWPRGISR